jgi:DNA-binding LacI/PurR family transcriptional regulator
MLSEPKPRKKYVSRAESLKRVEEELRFRVASNIWVAGVMLPSRRSLATELGVDLHTVQRAIAPLLEDGTLRADGGRGTFVAHRVDEDAATGVINSVGRPVNGTAQARLEGVRNRRPAGMTMSLGTLGIITAYDSSRGNRDDIAGIGSQEIVRSLERSFSDAGGKTVIYNLVRPDGSWETVPRATEALVRLGVECLAVIGIDHDPVLRDVAIPDWYNKSIPVVHISGEGDFQSPVHVYYDNRQAGMQAADHLLSVGCQSIVFLVPFSAPWLDDRIDGARLAMKQAGLPPEKFRLHPTSQPLVQWSDSAAVEFDAAIEEAFDLNLLSDGVIAPNDGVAHQVIRHSALRGKTIGKDFALIGFDDIPDSSFSGLTSLRPPFEEMGREASVLLIRMLGGDRVSLQLCLPSHLMVRSSTRNFQSQPGETG